MCYRPLLASVPCRLSFGLCLFPVLFLFFGIVVIFLIFTTGLQNKLDFAYAILCICRAD